MSDPIVRISRRDFLGSAGLSLGAIALRRWSAGSKLGGAPRRPRAKSVIYLHMAGSPPPVDLLDPKPLLAQWDGRPCPDEFLTDERFAFIKGHPKILASPYSFARHGESGASMSDLLPRIASVADRLCIVRSMYTDQFNHAPAQLLIQTGAPRLGRPSMGSWVLYGLGSENEDLPGFIVLVSGGPTPSAGKSVWGAGFLPGVHQGVQLRSGRDPVLYLGDPPGMSRDARRSSLDALNALNRRQLERTGDDETATRIAQYELAFRMQASVPEAVDIASEDADTLALYGAEPGKASFANHCLLARRLVERGVRFVQLYDWGWDTHGTNPSDDIITQLPKKCRETDGPIAALILDLERRGLLEETLVVWGGEFGRTAMNEERNGSKYLGRDHNPHSFTIFMAGGGIRAGTTYGATDEFGYRVVENPVHVHDLQATILHLLGLDHEALTYHHQGRDFRLTDVAGRVIEALLA